MYNNNIFKKICHDQSGQEFDLGYIEEGTFIETLSLDGPKLLLTMMDPYSYLRDGLKVKELDTLSVTLTDSFASDRLDANMTFTLLKMQSNGHFIKMQLMSTSVYQAKCFVTVSKSFIQKSITEILPYYIKGLKLDIGKFPIVEDYHCLAGGAPFPAVAPDCRRERGTGMGRSGYAPFPAVSGTLESGTRLYLPSQQIG